MSERKANIQNFSFPNSPLAFTGTLKLNEFFIILLFGKFGRGDRGGEQIVARGVI